MPISTANINKSQHLQDDYGGYQYLCVGISISLSLQESWHLPPSSLSLVGLTLESCRETTPPCLPYFLLPLHSPTIRWKLRLELTELSQQHSPCSLVAKPQNLFPRAWRLDTSVAYVSNKHGVNYNRGSTSGRGPTG